MSLKLPLLFTPPLLQYLRQHPQLPKDTWYFIAAATLTVLNRPDEISAIFKHALEHVDHTGDGQSKVNDELKVLRRIRESLLKTSAVAGAPKVINACIALKESTPKHLQDLDADTSITGRGADINEIPSNQVLQRGQAFFDRIYGKISSRVTRMMKGSGTEDLDLIAKLMYGYILSNTAILNQVSHSMTTEITSSTHSLSWNPTSSSVLLNGFSSGNILLR